MKGIDNFRQHILIIVVFQLWNICLFPFFAWIYSFCIYRGVDAKVAEAVHIPAHIQLKLNLVKVFVLAFELEVTVDKFTAKVSISTSL